MSWLAKSSERQRARRRRWRAKLRDPNRQTRMPLVLWDRLKFTLLFVMVWFVAVWYQMANDPVLGFQDAARQQLQVRSGIGRWLILLLCLELIRQLYYLVTEQSRPAYRASSSFFSQSDKLSHQMTDYTRFRLRRVIKWLIWIAVIGVILGIGYHTTPALGLFKVPAFLLLLLPVALTVSTSILFVIVQFGAIFWLLTRGGVDVYYPGDIKTRFADVWGQDHVVDRIQENMLFLEDPESIEDHGGYVPGGILLWGPPGTGKTLIAEAMAGETGLPYVFVDPGAFINMFFGIGVLKVKLLFRKLRKMAIRYGGVVVFFDEADSLGSRGVSVGGQPGVSGQASDRPAGGQAYAPASPDAGCHGFSYVSQPTRAMLLADAAGRLEAAEPAPRGPGRWRQILPAGGMMGGGGMGTLQALLTEMSGLKKPRGFVSRLVRRALGMQLKPPPKYRILIMMATNLVAALDQALLRPGRIDRIYHVGYPSKQGRKRTYEGYFAKVSHEVTLEQIDQLANMTPYATGATMKDLVNEALIVALRDDRSTITWQDVLSAKLSKSVGPSEGVDYIERERHAVAVHEACHAVVSYLAQKRNDIETATIQKGMDHLGFVQPIPIEEQFTRWRSEYEADIMVSLASLVGEKMFFGDDSSSGVSGDLHTATAISLNMEGRWGMGSQLGSFSATLAGQGAHPILDGTDRKVLETELGKRAEARLSMLADRTGAMLTEHRISVLAVGHALETHRTIGGQDITAIMNREQGPVVDGRPYADPEFITELEAYHLSASSIHGSERSLPLPVPHRHLTPELTAIPNASEHRAEQADEV